MCSFYGRYIVMFSGSVFFQGEEWRRRACTSNDLRSGRYGLIILAIGGGGHAAAISRPSCLIKKTLQWPIAVLCNCAHF